MRLHIKKDTLIQDIYMVQKVLATLTSNLRLYGVEEGDGLECMEFESLNINKNKRVRIV